MTPPSNPFIMSAEEREAEEDDLRAEVRAASQRARRLAANPDCRDPEHPGCEFCEGDEPEDEGDSHDQS